jgi:hypothetical protein
LGTPSSSTIAATYYTVSGTAITVGSTNTLASSLVSKSARPLKAGTVGNGKAVLAYAGSNLERMRIDAVTFDEAGVTAATRVLLIDQIFGNDVNASFPNSATPMPVGFDSEGASALVQCTSTKLGAVVFCVSYKTSGDVFDIENGWGQYNGTTRGPGNPGGNGSIATAQAGSNLLVCTNRSGQDTSAADATDVCFMSVVPAKNSDNVNVIAQTNNYAAPLAVSQTNSSAGKIALAPDGVCGLLVARDNSNSNYNFRVIFPSS